LRRLPPLDERERRLFAASERGRWSRWGGRGIVATGICAQHDRSWSAELKAAGDLGRRVRRAGGGGKAAPTRRPGHLAAWRIGAVVDPRRSEAPLGGSAKASASVGGVGAAGFIAGQKLVGRLLRRLGFSLAGPMPKTREGSSHPDRDAQRSRVTTLRQPSSAFRLVLGFDGEAFGSCGVLFVERLSIVVRGPVWLLTSRTQWSRPLRTGGGDCRCR